MAYAFHKSTPATGAVAMYSFKELLKAQGWTVQSSSDGTTYNASGDQITSGASGAGGFANNNAWVRLRDPAGLSEFIIQRGTTNLAWRFLHSRAARFTGGSPGATRTPSATDEADVLGGGTHASPTFVSFFTTDGNYRFQGAAESAAPYQWWLSAFPTGGGAPNAMLVYDSVTGSEPTDAALNVIWGACNGQNPGNYVQYANESTAVTGPRCVSYVPNVTASGGAVIGVGMCTVSMSTTVIYPDQVGTHPVTGRDSSIPVMYARKSSAGTPFFKGVSTIARINGVARTTGDTFTVLTTRDRIVMGQFSLPWDGSVPTV